MVMKKEIIEAFVEEMNDSFNDWVEFNGCDDEEQIEFIEEDRVKAIQKIREAKDLDEVYEVYKFYFKENGCEEWQGIKSYTSVFKSLVL